MGYHVAPDAGLKRLKSPVILFISFLCFSLMLFFFRDLRSVERAADSDLSNYPEFLRDFLNKMSPGMGT